MYLQQIRNFSEITKEEISYNWKSKYGGLDVQQLSKMKELEKELFQYKKIVAEQTLEIVILKDVIEKSFNAL